MILINMHVRTYAILFYIMLIIFLFILPLSRIVFSAVREARTS